MMLDRSFFVSFSGLILIAGLASAQVPDLINYQGRLTDGATLVNGNVEMVLSIYDSEFAATPLFEDSNTVTVVDGFYSTYIGDDPVGAGSLTSVLATSNTWLGVTVNGVALTPRERIAAVAYALCAGDVPDGSITSNKLANGSVHEEHLARGYQSGSLPVTFPPTGLDVIVTNVFLPAFQSTPIVTLGLSTDTFLPGDLNVTRLVLTSKSTSNFTARITIPQFHNVEYIQPLSVDTTIGRGFNTVLREVDGRPAIAHQEDSGDLLYVRANDANGTSWPDPVSVSTSVSHSISLSMEIVNGNPGISFVDNTLMFVRASNSVGSAWGTVKVVDAGTLNANSSLAIVNGNPSIAFEETGSEDLKFVRATDNDGDTWGVVVDVYTNGNVGYSPSLAVVNGKPAISFSENGKTIRYIQSDHASGNTWGQSPVVISTNGSGYYATTSLSIVNGRPAVAYEDAEGRLMYLRANDADGSSWHYWLPIQLDTQVDAPSLTVIDGHPAVAYVGGSGNDLRYVRALDPDGSVWSEPTVLDQEEIDTFGYTSLAPINGKPGIAYFYEDGVPAGARFVRVSDLTAAIEWIAIEP